MTQTFVEVLLLVPAAMTAGFVVFVAGVVQKMMNDMEALEFKRFLGSLTNHAIKSPLAITMSMATFVGMIPYWYLYGLSNMWYSAGLVLWIIASTISKQMTLPIYSKVTGRKFPGYKQETEVSDTDSLMAERQKLHRANIVRAVISFASIVLLVIGLFNS